MPPLVVDSPHALKNLVGQEIATTGWFPITQERIHQFAEATEDRQWIHIDRERAQQESPYGTTIAHGFLTLSLLSHFMKQALQVSSGVRMGINYGLNRVRFPAPVKSGSQIRAHLSLSSFQQIPRGFEAVFSVTVEIQDTEKPCCVAEWVVRYYC